MSFKTETSCSQTFPASNNFLQHVDVPNTVTTVAASAAGSLHFLQSPHLQAPSLPQQQQQQQQQIQINPAQIDFGQQQQSPQMGSVGQLGFASEVPGNSAIEEVSFTSQQGGGGTKIESLQFSLELDDTPTGQIEFSQSTDAKVDQLNYSVRQVDGGIPKELGDLDPSMVKQEPLDIAQIVEEHKTNISFNTRPLQQQPPVSFGHSVIDPKLAQFEFALKDSETLHFSSQIITNKGGGQIDFSPQIDGQSKQITFTAQPGDVKLEQPQDLKTDQLNFVAQLNTADQQALLNFGSHDQTNQGHLEFVRQQQQQPTDTKVDVMGFPALQDQNQIGFVQSALPDPNVQQLDFGQQHHGTLPVLNQSPDARLLICKHCQQTFYNSRDYQNHMKTQHGSVNGNGNGSNAEKRYTCEYCKKSLSRLYGLTQHIKTQHNRDKLYSCQHCGKTVTCFSELREHARTHKVNSFECRYCKKTFPRTYNLTLHIRTHTGEKPFSCTFCDKTFARSSNLVVHQRTHTGEQPFQCKDCKKCFSYSKQLKKHYSNCEGPESLVQQSVLNKSVGSYSRGNGLGENGLALGSNSISSNDITMSITSDINSVSNASSCSTGASSTVDMPISSTNASHTPTFIGQDSLDVKPDMGVFTRVNPPLPPLESFNNGTITSNNHQPHSHHQQQQLPPQLAPQMQPPTTPHHHVPHHQNNVQVKQEYNNTYPTNPVAAQFSAYPDGQTFDYRKPEDFIDPLEAPSFFTQDTMVMRQDYISNNDQPGYAHPAPQTHQPPYTTTNNTINNNQEDTITYINL